MDMKDDPRNSIFFDPMALNDPSQKSLAKTRTLSIDEATKGSKKESIVAKVISNIKRLGAGKN